MTTPVQNLLSNISLYKFNPSAIQRIVLDHLRAITAGDVDVVDPTNPFVFLLESSCVNTAATMIEHTALTRQLYPSLAQTPEELYRHMSDKDYLSRFATPAKTVFSMMVLKDDLMRKVVNIPGTQSYKTTIPRNSEFTVGDLTFSLQYPIDITVLEHGGLEVSYDNTIISPIQKLTTNVIDFEYRSDINLNNWLYFEFDVYQFKINSINQAVTPSSLFTVTAALTDSFYYARVFYNNNNTVGWTEILTTHTDQVYDSQKPTALIAVVGSNVTVQIPQVYVNTGQVSGNVRVDIYETKGRLNILLENYAASSFSTVLKTVDDNDNSYFTASFATMTFTAFSTKAIASGTNGISFQDLRTKVIANAIGDVSLPITNVQITSSLENAGYQVVKNVDVVTNRVFLATKSLPVPFDQKLITAANANIETFTSSIDNLVKNKDYVVDNRLIGSATGRVTILSNTLFSNTNGIVSIVPKIDLDTILNQTKDIIVNNVNSNNFIYTPFHYVLDTTNEDFVVRPYYLDKPLINSIEFIENNMLTGIQVNTNSFRIEKNGKLGYSIYIATKSNALYKQIPDDSVYVQLSFMPYLEGTNVFVNGVLQNINRLVTDERLYRFDLNTNFDIDQLDNLGITNFKMDTVDSNTYFTPLNVNMNITYSTKNKMPPQWNPSTVDKNVGTFIINKSLGGVAGITQETLRVSLGYSLNTLWCRSRTIVNSTAYETYEFDVPWYYEKDVLETNPLTNSVFFFDTDGNISYKVLFNKGDIMLNDNGDVTYRYRAGDIKLDAYGQPISLLNIANTLIRQIDLMCIEGSYYFANDYSVTKYRSDLIDDLITWLTIDLANMGDSLIEQTKLYFYPKKSLGLISVVADGRPGVMIDASQSFSLDLYVNQSTYKNSILRDSLTNLTVQTLNYVLQNRNISMSDVSATLRSVYKSSVLNFTIAGLGGASNYSLISLLNDKDSLSLKKKLMKLPDDSLIVTEDVTVNFILHSS